MERIQIVDTPTPGEVLAVFLGENGQPVNVTVTDHALQKALRETPTHIVNPDRAPLEESIFEAAEKKATDDAASVGATSASAPVDVGEGPE